MFKTYFANLKEHTKKLVEEVPVLKSSVDYIFRDPILFGDYRNALDIAEPRIYEDIQDYEAAKALFQQVMGFFFFLILNARKRLNYWNIEDIARIQRAVHGNEFSFVR